MSRAIIAVLLALSTSACGGGPGPRTRPAPPAPAETVTTDPLASPWVVRRTGEPVSQTIHVAAVIESRADTLRPPVVDTLQSQLTASWALPSAAYPRRYLGTVTDYRLSSAVGDSLVPPSGLSLPFSFAAEQAAAAAQVRFTTPDAAACGIPQASIVHGVRDLWLSLPDTLQPDLRWTDSSSYVVCRDSIPLTLDIRRDFRVTGSLWRDSSVIVTVERRTLTRLSGAGRQFGDSVSFSGEGTSMTMFEVSLETGAATFASGESELHVTMQGSRRRQELTQRSRISILDR